MFKLATKSLAYWMLCALLFATHIGCGEGFDEADPIDEEESESFAYGDAESEEE